MQEEHCQKFSKSTFSRILKTKGLQKSKEQLFKNNAWILARMANFAMFSLALIPLCSSLVALGTHSLTTTMAVKTSSLTTRENRTGLQFSKTPQLLSCPCCACLMTHRKATSQASSLITWLSSWNKQPYSRCCLWWLTEAAGAARAKLRLNLQGKTGEDVHKRLCLISSPRFLRI